MLRKPPMTVCNRGVDNLPDSTFDAVFCISVLEHVEPVSERLAWSNLASRVGRGGLLFITTDCVEHKGRTYMWDQYRRQNFTLEMLKERVEGLTSHGDFTPMGQPDWEWKGPQVHDYTFFRVGLIKNR